MYYILNQTNQVIAADDCLLELLHVENIDELTKQIILGDIQFTSLAEDSITFISPHDTFTYTIQTSILSSLLGNLRLVHILSNPDEKKDITHIVHTDNEAEETPLSEGNMPNTEESSISFLDEVDSLISLKESTDTSPDTIEETDLNNDVLLPSDTKISKESFVLSDEGKLDNNELFNLTIPNAPENTIDAISLESNDALEKISEPEPNAFSIKDDLVVEKDDISLALPIEEQETSAPSDTSTIIIDVDKISQNIGISSEDYTLFLNEYIDTAISLESDLKNTNTSKRSIAIDTLTQLADVLELPSVNEIIIQLHEHPHEENDTIIESFYSMISRLTTHTNKATPESTLTKDVSTKEETSLRVEEPLTSLKTEDKGFGLITLDGIKPIYFNFRLEEAANDLSLPVELIEEFVHDFIEQAHTETKKMLDAYEKGDLDTIQKIGHMLKGASSNLRINALSDTLYQIQFCEDSNALEDLIKQYWGHFLSFEQQIDMLSK